MYASAGVLTVETGQDAWVVLPQQAIWVPADTYHEVRWSEPVSMRSLYLNRHALARLPERCGVVTISLFTRVLILEAVLVINDNGQDGPQSRLILVILDELVKRELESLYLPLTGD